MQSPKYEKLIKLDASRTKLGTYFDSVYMYPYILAGKLKNRFMSEIPDLYAHFEA